MKTSLSWWFGQLTEQNAAYDSTPSFPPLIWNWFPVVAGAVVQVPRNTFTFVIVNRSIWAPRQQHIYWSWLTFWRGHATNYGSRCKHELVWNRARDLVVVAIIGLAGRRCARVKPPQDCANWKQFLKMEISAWNPDNVIWDWFGCRTLSLKCES